MREIKFRAWDKIGKRMLYQGKDFDVLNDILDSWRIGRCKNDMVWDCIARNVELMQYTGLKDLQGKEIYEGDILEFNNANNKKEYGIVKWNKTGFDVERLSIRYFPMTLSRYCRVIGNIYKNPELLGDKK